MNSATQVQTAHFGTDERQEQAGEGVETRLFFFFFFLGGGGALYIYIYTHMCFF